MVTSNRFKCAASLVIGLIIQKGGCFNSHTTQPFRRLSSKPSKFHQVSSHFPDYASTRRPVSSLKQSEGSSEDQSVGDFLSPVARKFLGGVSFLGMIETGYLTYSKLTSTQPQFCYFSGSCSDVLDGPYSSVGPIPLSAFGFLGLSLTLGLITLLTGKEEGNLASSENVVDEHQRNARFTSFIGTVLACFVFYSSVDVPTSSAASKNNVPPGGFSPPPIETTSSTESLQLARSIVDLDGKFYGAFWCSHCFDQKAALGKESMDIIPYIECSKDGKNSQSALCKEKELPGYPTWEINGQLYPGEQSLEELQEIVATERKTLS
eukprot:CAMPEP_0178972360 /NCGR_PEP_ID=MMETSP0789-20121207/20956_1 /TAXON_ID=3005 /ORGANISM="Rhizosolenia setigera, Strain CCMP 1694" /LENGTH=320 /DNA_ID=CAMNT_0020659771 /DNA_START=56 /DNA_END=1015 /DNA_ORIENTATION=-